MAARIDGELRRSGLLKIADSGCRELRLGYDAHLDGQAVVDRLARDLPPMAADLIEIAAMAYAADRLACRPADRYGLDGSGWGRQIWLQVPVRDPGRWTAVAGRLADFAGWLTHDHWSFEFSQLESGYGALDNAQGFLFDTVPDGASPGLFSGGLDSAVGLARDLQAGEAAAVSVHTNSRMQSVQRDLVSRIGGREERCVHLQYRIWLHERDQETSQRTRGLLFLAVGIGTAWAIGQDRLRVFENGIGAINLPYLRSQHGPQATRSMHPRTLWLAEELATAVSGRPFRIEAPFLPHTKAEAIAAANGLDVYVAAATVSCDTGFASRVRGISHCGRCTSCLLRRQALIAAGRVDADAATAYRTRTPAGTEELIAMNWQLDRLRDALADPEPWHGLVSEFPAVLDVVSLTPAEVTRLYQAYAQEWEAIGPDFTHSAQSRPAAL